MSGGLSADLREISAAVEVLALTRFRFACRMVEVNGTRPPFAPGRQPPTAGGPRAAARLIGALTDELYSRWYTRAGSVSGAESDPVVRGEHLRRLSEADGGRGVWEPGWKVRDIDQRGGCTVERQGVVFRLAAELVRHADELPRPGSACRVWVPAEMRGAVAGSWCTRGATDLAAPGEAPWVVRIYWHLRPAAAAPLVRILTSGLDRLGVAFRLKVVGDPAHYLRADAGVLFLEPEGYAPARETVRLAYRELRGELGPEVPRLTHQLAPGLAVSEGPEDGESFGGHRCGLIARGLMRAFESGGRTPAARRQEVRAAFLAAGLDPRRPHLAAGSRSRYPRLRGKVEPPVTAARRRAGHRRRPVAPLDRAAGIGDALCRAAYRAGGRCNWVGIAPGRGPGGATAAALGSDLYGGTAGVGLFLAELYSLSRDEEHRRTAVGALRQALWALRSEPGRLPRTGFYEGWLGVAWTARSVASHTGSEELAAEAAAFLSEPIAAPARERARDVLSGDAGAILALLRLHEETGEGRFLEAAAQIGGELAEASTGGRERPRLTGFSHGAAGIGLALLELSVATGAAGLANAARWIFDREDALFDPELSNWPDLRVPGKPGFMVAWCHGAAGIALSRLRAIAVDPSHRERYEAAARAGLDTTLARIDRDLGRPEADACLCHGLGGLIEIASYGAAVLDDRALGDRARDAELRFVHSLDHRRAPDPCLLTGEAGVGRAALRIGQPWRLPSMLLPGLWLEGADQEKET